MRSGPSGWRCCVKAGGRSWPRSAKRCPTGSSPCRGAGCHCGRGCRPPRPRRWPAPPPGSASGSCPARCSALTGCWKTTCGCRTSSRPTCSVRPSSGWRGPTTPSRPPPPRARCPATYKTMSRAPAGWRTYAICCAAERMVDLARSAAAFLALLPALAGNFDDDRVLGDFLDGDIEALGCCLAAGRHRDLLTRHVERDPAALHADELDLHAEDRGLRVNASVEGHGARTDRALGLGALAATAHCAKDERNEREGGEPVSQAGSHVT